MKRWVHEKLAEEARSLLPDTAEFVEDVDAYYQEREVQIGKIIGAALYAEAREMLKDEPGDIETIKAD